MIKLHRGVCSFMEYLISGWYMLVLRLFFNFVFCFLFWWFCVWQLLYSWALFVPGLASQVRSFNIWQLAESYSADFDCCFLSDCPHVWKWESKLGDGEHRFMKFPEVMVSTSDPDPKSTFTTSICPNCSKCRTYLTGQKTWWPSPVTIMYLTTLLSASISCLSLYKVTNNKPRLDKMVQNSDWFRCVKKTWAERFDCFSQNFEGSPDTKYK